MTKDEAKKIAERCLRRMYHQRKHNDNPVVIIDEQTVEKSFGYIFCYDSKRYVETGQREYAYYGNIPLVVEHDGRVFDMMYTGGKGLENSIANYEKERLQENRRPL